MQTLASYAWFFNASGLAGVSKELHFSINADGSIPANELATMSQLISAFAPRAIISVFSKNEFEFRATLQAWKYGVRQTAIGRPDDIVLYAHNKGATHGTTFVPVLAATAGNWKFIRHLFGSGSRCAKAGGVKRCAVG